MKYNEEELLRELKDYIAGTYNQHYATDKIQTLDLIDACGDAEAFCRSNILNVLLVMTRRALPVVTLLKSYIMDCCCFISATKVQTVKTIPTDDRNFPPNY